MPRLLIGGTQSSGTTLMLALLHRLGGNTGYTDKEVDRIMIGDNDRNSGKGLEYHRDKKQGNPDIVKEACWDTDNGRKYNVIRHATTETLSIILCVRNLDNTVKSVRNFQSLKKYRNPMYPEAVIQKNLVEGTHKLLLDMTRLDDMPISLIEFPRFALDVDYLESKLMPLLEVPYGDDPILPDGLADLPKILKETVQQDRIHY